MFCRFWSIVCRFRQRPSFNRRSRQPLDTAEKRRGVFAILNLRQLLRNNLFPVLEQLAWLHYTKDWKGIFFQHVRKLSTSSTLAFIPNRTCRDKFSGTLDAKDFYAGAVLGSPRKHSLPWPSNNALWRQHTLHRSSLR